MGRGVIIRTVHIQCLIIYTWGRSCVAVMALVLNCSFLKVENVFRPLLYHKRSHTLQLWPKLRSRKSHLMCALAPPTSGNDCFRHLAAAANARAALGFTCRRFRLASASRALNGEIGDKPRP